MKLVDFYRSNHQGETLEQITMEWLVQGRGHIGKMRQQAICGVKHERHHREKTVLD